MFPQIERTKTTFTRNAESSKKKKTQYKAEGKGKCKHLPFCQLYRSKKKKHGNTLDALGLFFSSLYSRQQKKVVFHDAKLKKRTQKKKLVYIASPHRITQAPQHFFFLVFVNAKRKLSKTPQGVRAKWKSSTVKHDAERCPFSSCRIKKKKREGLQSFFFFHPPWRHTTTSAPSI